MERFHSCFGLKLPFVFILAMAVPATFLPHESTSAFTVSVGQPYHGRLVDGVPFPEQFQGYNVRSEDRAYATPELIGALLDAVDGVRQKDPATCELFLGDISRDGGGGISSHRSHQNGRDVDLGMFAKGNRRLSTFIPMNEENLDVPKTWALIENLLKSQRVQYIFLDRRIQNLLYDYAVCRGVDPTYLDHLFGGGRGSIIQHQRNHHDHMHVRFYAPWSTMAAQVGAGDEQKRNIIEMAQQAYLPKKVNYYVKGTEPSLDALAHNFGVSRKDLARWNQLQGSEALRPGSCLVFYKRGFEMEPVRLAQSLQPNAIPEAPMVRMASLRSLGAPGEGPVSLRGEPSYRGRSHERSSVAGYKVRKGDTLKSIARRNGVDVKTLARMNGVKKYGALKPGRTLQVVNSKSKGIPAGGRSFEASGKTCDPRIVRLGVSDSVPPSSGYSGSLKGYAASRDGDKIRLAQARTSEKSGRVLSDASSSSGSSKSAKSRGNRASLKKDKEANTASTSKRAAKEASRTAGKAGSSSKGKVESAKKSSRSESVASKKPTGPEKASKNTKLAKRN